MPVICIILISSSASSSLVLVAINTNTLIFHKKATRKLYELVKALPYTSLPLQNG